MCNYVDEDQIMVEELPDYSYHYVKRLDKDGKLEKYQNLV
jgi:hypothetical protein